MTFKELVTAVDKGVKQLNKNDHPGYFEGVVNPWVKDPSSDDHYTFDRNQALHFFPATSGVYWLTVEKPEIMATALGQRVDKEIHKQYGAFNNLKSTKVYYIGSAAGSLRSRLESKQRNDQKDHKDKPSFYFYFGDEYVQPVSTTVHVLTVDAFKIDCFTHELLECVLFSAHKAMYHETPVGNLRHTGQIAVQVYCSDLNPDDDFWTSDSVQNAHAELEKLAKTLGF